MNGQECGSSLLHSEADLKEQSVSHSIDTWRMAVTALTLRVNYEKVGLIRSVQNQLMPISHMHSIPIVRLPVNLGFVQIGCLSLHDDHKCSMQSSEVLGWRHCAEI